MSCKSALVSLKEPVLSPSNDHSLTELSGSGWSSSSNSELLHSPSLPGRGNVRCPEEVAKRGSVGWMLKELRGQSGDAIQQVFLGHVP